MTGARSMWTAGTVLLALVLAAAGWLLLISPELERTAALDDSRVLAEDRNATLAAEVAALSADLERLGELQAGLAELRTQVPASVDLAELTRELGRMVEDSGATVRSLQVGVPVALTEVEDLTAAAAPEAATTSAPAGMYAVPVALTVSGEPGQVRDYVDRLQSPGGRLLLMSQFSIAVDDEGTATVSTSGHTYVLADGAADAAAEDGS